VILDKARSKADLKPNQTNGKILKLSDTNISVSSLIENRLTDKSFVGARNDPHHLALVIEGGGMRGTYVAGMLHALQQAGCRQVFDSIHASSVGAHLAAYFAAGQADVGRAIFVEDALNKRFISFRRIFCGGPIMDTEWMVKNVFAKSKRMQLENIITNKTPISIICTSAKTGKSVVFSDPTDEKTFFSSLIATSKIPFVAGPPFELNGHFLTDGGIAQQIAVKSAVENGATHALILTTGKKSRVRKTKSSLSHLFEKLAVRVIFGKDLASAYDKRRDCINEVLDSIVLNKPTLPISAAGVFAPENAPSIKRLTKNKMALSKAASECENSMYTFLGHR